MQKQAAQTLEDLALEQQNNPGNPWLAQTLENTGLPGQVQLAANPVGAGGAAGSNAPIDENDPNAWAKAAGKQPITSPYGGDPYTKSPEQKDKEYEQRLIKLGHSPEEARSIVQESAVQRPGAPQADPGTIGPDTGTGQRIVATPVGGSGSGGGGVPHKSLERGLAEQLNATDDERAKLIDKNKESVNKEQAIRELGASTARDLTNKANIDFYVNQSDLQTLQRQTLDHAQRQSSELQSEAEALRQEKIDPRHWFKERGTAGSILAAIAMGAGAFAAAMPHTNSKENFALGIINDSISRDVDAQKSNLEQKWKALNFKGTAQDKEFVRNQWMIDQKSNMMYKAYDHAMNMVSQARLNTQDQVAASNLDKMLNGLEQQKLELKDDKAKRMYGVAAQEAARAAAAAARENISPRERLKMIDDMVKLGYSEKDAASAVDYRISGGRMGGSPAVPSKLSGGSGGKEEAIIEDIGLRGAKITGGYGSAIAGALGPIGQNIAPDAAREDQDRLSYNESVLPGFIRAAGERVDHNTLKEMAKRYEINPGDSPQIRQQKVRGAQEFIKGTLGLRNKGPAGQEGQ